MTIQTQSENTHPVEDFLHEVSTFSKDVNPEKQDPTKDPRFANLADSLYYLGLGIGTSPGEDLAKNYPIDRRTRSIVSLLADKLKTPDQEADPDDDIRTISLHGIDTILRKVGIQEVKEKSSKPAAEYIELVPNVSEEILSQLEQTENMKKQGKPQALIMRTVAQQYLAISFAAHKEIEAGVGGQRKIDMIGQMNAYAHTFGQIIMDVPPRLRPSTWMDIKSRIINEIGEKRGIVIDDIAASRLPEIQQFENMMRGVQLEVDGLTELERRAQNVRSSTLEEDVKEGFDLAFDIGEESYYLDVKSSGAFRNLERNMTIIEDGVGVKTSKVSGRRIIVVDAQKRGHNGKHSNKFDSFTNPQDFWSAVQSGMKTVNQPA